MEQHPEIMEQAQEAVTNILPLPSYNWEPEIAKLPKLYQDKGFKNFIPRNKWEIWVKETLIRFAKEEQKKSLVLLGAYGTGKSHLAISVMKNLPPQKKRRMISKDDKNRVEKYDEIYQRAYCTFLVVDEFFQELNDCFVDKKSKEAVITKYLHENDIVCLDDLDTDNFSTAKAENLYLFINRAYLDEKRIIVTTNFTMENLERKVPKVTSRLAEMAIIIPFNGQDYRKENQ